MYPLLGLNQSYSGSKQEEIGGDFRSLASYAYQQNGIVFGCIVARMLLFSEARFQFRQLRSGRPGDYFGTEALAPLETPWPGGTTGDLLARAELDVSLAGNSFTIRRPGNKLKRMRPDWTTIVLGSNTDPDVEAGDVDAEVLGYIYQPGGAGSGREPEAYLREQVAHYAPIPDPLASYRGMSWISPVIREIMGDKAATEHKMKFFEHGGVPPVAIKFDASVRKEAFEAAVEKIKAGHEGVGNAYKWLFLGAGADPVPLGVDMKQMDFKVTQGAGETRLAVASRVPAVILGISEGLQGSSLNQGNYQMARRQMVDMLLRPLWRNFAGSLANIIDVPGGAELWYDDRDIPALREDEKDAAEIQQVQAASIKALVDVGFDTGSVVEAITSGDLRRLKHTGLVSVQLLPPGSQKSSGNGNGAVPAESVSV